MAYNEEDIFNSAADATELILRFGDHTRDKFDKAKFKYTFEYIKNLIANEELPCFISKQTDTEHKITIPLHDIGGQLEIIAVWNYGYEIKVNKHKKTKYNPNSELLEKQYLIEQTCTIRFIDVGEKYENYKVLGELSNLKRRVDALEIAPKTIIENQREIWTKYIEAQELLIKHLQEPFNCTGKYEPLEQNNRIKFKVDLVADKNDEYRFFEEELTKLDIDEKFNRDGTILLKWNDISTGLDTIIQRKFSEILEREKKIGCILKICPIKFEKKIESEIQKQLSHIKVFRKYQQNKEVVVSQFSKSNFNGDAKIVRQILEKSDFKEKRIQFKIQISNLDKEEWTDENGNIFQIEYKGGGIPKINDKKQIITIPEPNKDIVSINGNDAKKYFDFLSKIYGKENVKVDDVWLYFECENEIIDETSLSEDFWKELKRDLYETGIKLEQEQFLTFDFTTKEEFEAKCQFLVGLNKFDFVKSPLDEDFKFKCYTNLIAKKTAKQIFQEKIEKLRGVEFVFDKSNFIGKLSANESSINQLVFNISNHYKDEKKLANVFLKFIETKPEIKAIQANLRGDEAKTKWLREAMDKLKEQNQQSDKPNSKPVNPKIRDFIFDSSKAETTFKFDFTPIEESDEYKVFPKSEILKLNDSQRKSVLRALFAKDLCLLQGPPGTGKTTVIAELIWQHIRQSQTTRLLVTSETNLAVDNVLEKLMNVKNANPELAKYITLIKPIRFGKATKFEEEGKKYSIERIEKWLEEECVKEVEYENEQLGSADELEEDTVEDNPNLNAIQQWMIRIAERSNSRNQKYENVLKDWVIELSIPVKETKQFFKDKYFKYANVIGGTCSSTGSSAFARDYQTIFNPKATQNTFKKISEIYFLITNKPDSRKIFSLIEDLGLDLENPTANHFEELKNALSSYQSIIFDTVIMDEASKATPPDLLLPLCFGKKSIVIGDHRQLPPLLSEKDFKETLLDLNDKKAIELAEEIDREFVETSQFKRLILNPQVSHTIKSTFNVQYRMHPHINDVIKQFYLDDECGGLVCGLDKEQVDSPDLKNPQSRYHGFFHDGFINDSTHTIWVNVDEPEMIDGTSRTNEMEVEAVKRVLTYLKHSQGFDEYMKFWDGIKDEEKRKLEKEVGIISFYGKQVGKLRDIRTTAKQLGIPVRLNTVDKFQGMERNIIIVSTVRSDKLNVGNNIIKPNSDIGFAKAPERLNVALSRARRLLIVVGNKNFFYKFKDREGNPLYKNAMDEIAKNGRIIDYKTLNEYTKK
jgi:tRNA A37 threonylcarbamoyladenosine biosynthesis protein TsaE